MVTQTGLVIVIALVVLALGIGAAALFMAAGRGGGLGLVQQQLGELLLGDLLAQVLPAGHFTLQHTFRSGERVDAVVRLGPALVPVDAKFPLEDFRRLLEATDDEARARARKAFVARVRKHIDDVAAKYILPDEGTYDFALMYVPAENVYYEAIVRDDGAGSERSLGAYALEEPLLRAQ